MATKKESRNLPADGRKNRNPHTDELIQTKAHLKRKTDLKDYEGGIDPQDEQLNIDKRGSKP